MICLQTDLFVNESADESESDIEDDDTTDSSDSDSSVYSGLGEDEEDSSVCDFNNNYFDNFS